MKKLSASLTLVMFLAGCYPVAMRADEAGRPIAVSPQAPAHSFGYFTAGPIVYSKFNGGIKGLSAGQGFTLTVPPFWPVGYALSVGTATAITLPLAVIEAEGNGDMSASANVFAETYNGVADVALSQETLSHGYRDPKAKYISDFSLDLSFSYASYDDELNTGGSLDYTNVLFGIKLAAPAWRVPKYYLRAGAGLHYFDYTDRPYASMPGFYVGGGLEMLISPTTMVGVEYLSHFYAGDDSSTTNVSGGSNQLMLNLSYYF